jgi:hypothetical protein
MRDNLSGGGGVRGSFQVRGGHEGAAAGEDGLKDAKTDGRTKAQTRNRSATFGIVCWREKVRAEEFLTRNGRCVLGKTAEFLLTFSSRKLL